MHQYFAILRVAGVRMVPLVLKDHELAAAATDGLSAVVAAVAVVAAA
jgi:hypothetical protein